MKLRLIFIISFAFIINVESLPRFAIRMGDKCSDCHVNPTGGMIRNENGYFFGKDVISLISPHNKNFPTSQKISDNVSFGLDYRSQLLYSDEKKRADFQDMSGSVYLNVSASEKIDIAARYDFLQSIWEAFAIAKIFPNNSYIKVGSFIPYFGIRIDDHTAYTRGGDFGLLFSTGAVQGLIYNPFYTETGIELGIYLSDFLFITSSLGKSNFNSTFTSDPTFTSRIEFTPSFENFNLLIGSSFAAVKTKNTGITMNTNLYSIFGEIGTKYFSLTSEYDIAKNYLSNNYNSSALMIEAALQLMVGLDAIVRYDNFNPNTIKKNDEHSRIILGVEFFPFSFVELRPQYRIQLENPEARNNSFVLQFHFWY
ncbi:MAG: hypothetical protein WHS65_08155 [Melioribacteraceae bacterium]